MAGTPTPPRVYGDIYKPTIEARLQKLEKFAVSFADREAYKNFQEQTNKAIADIRKTCQYLDQRIGAIFNDLRRIHQIIDRYENTHNV